SYHHLSSLFSSTEGLTIGRFFILHKIERAKELLAYEEITLGEIGYRLGYSSIQHLSNQFKTVTGLAPSHFRKIGSERRKPLDMVT
ncbi:MAG: helix-turn-helix domain-containing protein, partial [Candidatus Neomarinimicrobiota bacterium]